MPFDGSTNRWDPPQEPRPPRPWPIMQIMLASWVALLFVMSQIIRLRGLP